MVSSFVRELSGGPATHWKRALREPRGVVSLLALLVCAAASCAAFWPMEARAQFQRNLPAGGVVGVLAANPNLPLPMVQIDSRVFRLAPGGIIVDQNNRTILHAQIPLRAAAYIFFDGNGDVQRMFLLTPDELQRLRAR